MSNHSKTSANYVSFLLVNLMRSLLTIVCCISVFVPTYAFGGTDFTGFWKTSCTDDAGVQIKPAENQLYSISFCQPGRCFNPGEWEPNSRIDGDPEYKVVSPNEIGIRRKDHTSEYIMYKKCDNDPAYVVDANKCLALSWIGTWKGTIGKTPVMMEFDQRFSGETVGKYYYRTSIVDLILKKDEKVANLWQEFDPQNKLTGLLILNCNGNSLTGEWKSPDGKATHLVQAERIDNFSKTNIAPIYESPVMSYPEPRLNALKKSVIKRDSIGKHQFEIIGALNVNSENVKVTGLQLLGDSKGIRKINDTLLNEFLKKFEEAISCITAGKSLGSNPDNLAECGSDDSKVIVWSNDFVVIDRSTYNLVSGDREDVSLWLTKPYRMEIEPSSGLGKILSPLYLKHRGEEYGQGDEKYEEECLEASSFSVSWPSDEGITFSSAAAHAMAGCNDNFTAPYDVLWPYLTSLGQSHAKSFQH